MQERSSGFDTPTRRIDISTTTLEPNVCKCGKKFNKTADHTLTAKCETQSKVIKYFLVIKGDVPMIVKYSNIQA